jgi:hypothetical protein
MAEANANPTIDDAASKVTSSHWMLLKDVYRQFRESGLEPSETGQRLIALLCQWPSMPVKKRYVNSGREEILPAEDWQTEVVSLSVGIDATTGADYLEIHSTEPYRHPSLPDDPVEFLVPAANVGRELDRLTSITAAPLPEELSNKPRQKPGPKPDFDWEKIEAKCYGLMDHNGDFTPDDPDWDCQARLETALMKFCQDTWGREPGESTLRDKLPEWLLTWRKRKTGGA